jgi:hypothetical protein
LLVHSRQIDLRCVRGEHFNTQSLILFPCFIIIISSSSSSSSSILERRPRNRCHHRVDVYQIFRQAERHLWKRVRFIIITSPSLRGLQNAAAPSKTRVFCVLLLFCCLFLLPHSFRLSLPRVVTPKKCGRLDWKMLHSFHTIAHVTNTHGEKRERL